MENRVMNFIVPGDIIKITKKNPAYPNFSDLTWQELEVVEVARCPNYDSNTDEWLFDEIQVAVKDEKWPEGLAWYLSNQFELIERYYWDPEDKE